jgi:hypothetical protein
MWERSWGAGLVIALALASGQINGDSEAAASGRIDALITAPYTRATGATVPPGGEADRDLDANIGRKTPDEMRDDIIDKSICRGC